MVAGKFEKIPCATLRGMAEFFQVHQSSLSRAFTHLVCSLIDIAIEKGLVGRAFSKSVEASDKREVSGRVSYAIKRLLDSSP